MKPDGVGQDDGRSVRQPDAPQRRVEGGKQHVLGQHAGPGQAVEQRRFSGVGVADDRDHRKRHLLALGAVQVAGAAHLFELALQLDDLVLQRTPVGLDLGFAGAAEKARSAALAFKVRPTADQPALLVGQMRKLDLQRAFLGAGAAAEDFEDQPGAVEHLGVQVSFSRLRCCTGVKRMVDDHQLPPRRRCTISANSSTLPVPSKVAGRGSLTVTIARWTRSRSMACRKADRFVQPRFRRARESWTLL